ncbi:MAG TPA: hypothetical protein PLN56_08585 [Methanoregulaceae archaeon]|nr:hypothetical protein [Methanothrix sp.]HOL44620.1 hypothetical protein [Methanothrix sp.]HON93884.1 hypothetical protein [Sedimentisphaerales bacterium]HPD11040.1 hypothetical protein [Methanoregulaceae archaeon]
MYYYAFALVEKGKIVAGPWLVREPEFDRQYDNLTKRGEIVTMLLASRDEYDRLRTEMRKPCPIEWWENWGG